MVANNSFSGSSQTSSPAERANHATTSRDEALHDATLVRRFRAGDAAAFAEIVTRYRGKMFAVAFAHLRNHTDAEEIAQDTFIRAHRALFQFRGESSLATWLHRITVNLARNRYWYFFRRRRHLTQSLDHAFGNDSPATFADVVASDAPGPARETANREFSDLVDGCMGQLTPPQREILTQRNVLDRSYDEIAATLRIKVGTVKSRIARARGSLRAILNKVCPEFAPDAPPLDCFDPVRTGGRWQAGSV